MSTARSIRPTVAAVAGTPAGGEFERAKFHVAAYQQSLTAERAQVLTTTVANHAEAEIGARLSAMRDWGWHLLANRRPSLTQPRISLIHIGPGGVLVIDVKAWSDPSIVDGHLFQGDVDADTDVDTLRQVADAVADAAAELGLAPIEVIPVMVFMGRHGANTELGRVRILDEHTLVPWAVARGNRLSADRISELAAVLDARFPSSGDAADTISEPQTQPILVSHSLRPSEPAGRHRESPDDPIQQTLFDAAALEQALVSKASLTPIEEWMTFLHPEQIRLVRKLSAGPSRIRGAAGTGKTVVALHRAAFLAESLSGQVLVTSFIKTLPPALSGLYARLSPATVDRVEFLNLHSWAAQFLADRGHRLRLDPNFNTQAFNRAWTRHGKQSCLDEVGVNSSYWRDEIDHVIKGRGITDFEQYATLSRVGRRTRLGEAQRRVVWSVHLDYQAQLSEAGMIDYNDQLSLALDEAHERPLKPAYSAVIADEVQDLNCLAVRLLVEISGAGERLLVVGDGQQQIYPGGYTLAEAGISVAGRSTVLRHNYRNRAEIIAEACKIVAEDEFEDLDGAPEGGQRDITATRPGGQVWRVDAPSIDALRRQAVDQVRQLIADGARPDDVAVLCSTNFDVAAFQDLLKKAGVASLRLSENRGHSANSVKVGTVQRAKGLEFKHVVLPIHERARAFSRPEPDDVRHEHLERTHRHLFVAMTRARDSLWIGRVA